MRVIGLFAVAGLLEIGGGYLVWLWLRQQRSPLMGLIGMVVLAVYGIVQREGMVVHLLAKRLVDKSERLGSLFIESRDFK